jgi:hypothetical protein
MTIRTSDSHPIRVDFLPADSGLGPGRLGMTFAPGKKTPGIGGQWERDLDADLRRLVEEYQARVLVTLMEPHEYDDFGIPDLPEAAKRHGLDVIALAIPDAGIPSSTSDVADLVRGKMRRECRNASRRSRRVRKWRRDAPRMP